MFKLNVFLVFRIGYLIFNCCYCFFTILYFFFNVMWYKKFINLPFLCVGLTLTSVLPVNCKKSKSNTVLINVVFQKPNLHTNMWYAKFINLPFLCVGLTLTSVKIFYICCEANNSIRLLFIIYCLILLFSFFFLICLLFNSGQLSYLISLGKALREKKIRTIFFFLFIACPNRFLVNNRFHPYGRLAAVFLLNVLSYFSETAQMTLVLYIFLLSLFTLLATCYEQFPYCHNLFHDNIFAGADNSGIRGEFIWFFFGNPGTSGREGMLFMAVSAFFSWVTIKGPELFLGSNFAESTFLSAQRENFVGRNPLATPQEIALHMQIYAEQHHLPIYHIRQKGLLNWLFSRESSLPLTKGTSFTHKGFDITIYTAQHDRPFHDGTYVKIHKNEIGSGVIRPIDPDGPEKALFDGCVIGNLYGGSMGASIGARLGENGVEGKDIIEAVKRARGEFCMPGTLAPQTKGPVATSMAFLDGDSEILLDFFQLC